MILFAMHGGYLKSGSLELLIWESTWSFVQTATEHIHHSAKALIFSPKHHYWMPVLNLFVRTPKRLRLIMMRWTVMQLFTGYRITNVQHPSLLAIHHHLFHLKLILDHPSHFEIFQDLAICRDHLQDLFLEIPIWCPHIESLQKLWLRMMEALVKSPWLLAIVEECLIIIFRHHRGNRKPQSPNQKHFKLCHNKTSNIICCVETLPAGYFHQETSKELIFHQGIFPGLHLLILKQVAMRLVNMMKTMRLLMTGN